MAAATYTLYRAIDYVQERFVDTGASWITAARIQERIGKHVVIGESACLFYKDTTDYYRYQGLPDGCVLVFASEKAIVAGTASPFSGSNDAVYQISCEGSIYVSTGTHSATEPISITAAVVNIAEVIVDLCLTQATQRVGQDSQSVGGASINPVLPEDRFIKMAERWRGVQ